MRPRARAAARLGVTMSLLVLGSCVRMTPVERADWGAIPADATVRITTLNGNVRTLSQVVVSTDALEGFATEGEVPVRVPLDSIEYLENRSGPSAFPILLTIAAGIAAIAIIDASGEDPRRPAPTLVASISCPFLYSFDGDEYVFDSETYAGAITRGLERTDLDNLDHLRAIDGTYRLRLTNERPETEYTDALSLLVVDHPEGSAVHPDSRGSPRGFARVRGTTTATGIRGGDFTRELEAPDGRVWVGDPVATTDLGVDSELRDGVELTFPRPGGERALLAIHAQNTDLAARALQMFLELQGDDLVQWYRRVDHDPAARGQVAAWVMREGTLHVSVWIDGAWRLQDMLLTVGPMLPKTQLAQLDIRGVTGDEVRVRIESARGFWSLDWVALGTEPDGELVLTSLVPSRAEDARGRDLAGILASADGAYYTALEGDRVELEFLAPPPPRAGSARTVLARSTGFYHTGTRAGGPAQTQLTERILTEPLFGSRYLIEQLRLAAAQGAGG